VQATDPGAATQAILPNVLASDASVQPRLVFSLIRALRVVIQQGEKK
jgi:hypothetical protein